MMGHIQHMHQASCGRTVHIYLSILSICKFHCPFHDCSPMTDVILSACRSVPETVLLLRCWHACSLFSSACSCHHVGSVLSDGSPLCSPNSGECTCKPGVGGPHCDRCMMGYWGLHEYGCRPCDCTGSCDPYTGDCTSGYEPGIMFHPKSDKVGTLLKMLKKNSYIDLAFTCHWFLFICRQYEPKIFNVFFLL